MVSEAIQRANESVDAAITDYLKTNGMTRQELANKLNISTNALRWKCNGTHSWKWSEIITLSQLLGIPVAELAGCGTQATEPC